MLGVISFLKILHPPETQRRKEGRTAGEYEHIGDP
jgi:hypothetical protein